MTNNKPLGEWTLNEVKAECDKRGNCESCPFCGNKEDGLCNLEYIPDHWDLSEPPRPLPDGFDRVYRRWKAGAITVGAAAAECGLPPSTFRSRAKAYEEEMEEKA